MSKISIDSESFYFISENSFRVISMRRDEDIKGTESHTQTTTR